MNSSVCKIELPDISNSSTCNLVENRLDNLDHFIKDDFSQTNHDTIASPNTSSLTVSTKRKFSVDSRVTEEFSPKNPKSKCSSKPVKIDVDDTAVERNENKKSVVIHIEKEITYTNEEQENGINSSTISCNDNSNNGTLNLEEPSKELTEDIARDDKLSYYTSQASENEASLSLSDSLMSSESSESDIFVADGGHRRQFSDDDNNNNHWSNDIRFMSDSHNESESNSDDLEEGVSDEIPQVLKKTLPSQKFNFPREIMNRQFSDNFKRRETMKFENKVCGSRRMVQRLKLYRQLKKHSGSVDTISFNDTGEVLLSGSHDCHVCLWNWANKKCLFYFDPGHSTNVLQAKFLPFTNTHIVTCGADNQIRMCLLDQRGLESTSLIVKHSKIVNKIALRKQMPNTFLSACGDGTVYSIDIREANYVPHKLLKVMNIQSKPQLSIFLYSIDCNPLKNHEFIVCGNDKNIRLFDQRKISPDNSYPIKMFCPSSLGPNEDPFHQMSRQPLKKNKKSVTSAVFNYNGTEVLASYHDNDIYLFDSYTSEEVHHYDGHRNFASTKGVNFFGPRSEYVVSGSDCGYVYLWDKNSEAIVQWLKGDKYIVNYLEPHPSFPILATSGIDFDVKIWMPTQKNDINIKELPEFQKVATKNYFYKYTASSGYLRRWGGLQSSFLANNITEYLFQLFQE